MTSNIIFDRFNLVTYLYYLKLLTNSFSFSRSSVPPKKRQKRDSGSINEPEVAIKDFAKNLKDESDITSPVQPQSSTASMAASVQLPPGLDGGREPKQEPHHHNMGIVDDQDETSTSNASMASKFDEKTGSNNSGAAANPFLGMAAASLMDPSAAKGEKIKKNLD